MQRAPFSWKVGGQGAKAALRRFGAKGPGPRRWLLAAVAVWCAAVGWFPLFGGFSYEYGLAVGVVVPLLVAPVVAYELRGSARMPSAMLVDAVWVALRCWAVTALVGVLHGLRSGFCDLIGEFTHFSLATVLGVVAAAVWGGCVAIAAPGRVGRAWLFVPALALPLGSMLFSFLRYYTSPIIFAFDHFVGFFSGTLYDTELQGTTRLLTYRLATLGWILAALAASKLLRRAPRGLEVVVQGRWGSVLGLVTAASVATGITLSGPRLGHYQTTQTVTEQLGHAARSERCRVVYDASIDKREAHALARECDAHVNELESFFETEAAPVITVFLFASAEQKAWLMGARNVYIAKPWRHEIYIQRAGFPHPVLRHELAHVVAASFAQGPFGVAGPLGGWIPDPGRIEGLAVAAAPSDDDDLTLFQWAAAMQRLELLPPLRSVFRLGFLGENASSAYTVAGAYVAWLRDEFGMDVVRSWYAGADLEQLTERSWAALEQSFRESLSRLRLEAAELAVARARFDRPGVFGRRCPHQVDAKLKQARGALGRGDTRTACADYRTVLAMDEHNRAALLGVGQCHVRSGELEQAREYYSGLADRQHEQPLLQAWALEAAADAALLAGSGSEASAGYQQAAKRVLDEDHLRQLSIKRYAALLPEASLGRRAIVALLLGDAERGTDWAVSGALLGQWSQADAELGIAAYLLGVNWLARNHWERAAQALDEALERRIPLPRVEREAWRARLRLACLLGDADALQRSFDKYSKTKPSRARRDGAERFVRRCQATWRDAESARG